MRGNLRRGIRHAQLERSIPAYAGEPLAPARCVQTSGVYPRVCGGTWGGGFGIAIWSGLSPRMRGNPASPDADRYWPGSIPAYAGEPAAHCITRRRAAVYPRVCGGTQCACGCGCDGQGLSPRMRGNQGHYLVRLFPDGSIPAYAGEPPRKRSCMLTMPVYPRVCGGTHPGPFQPGHIQGLSPRMRGNHSRSERAAAQPGSIPAYAGEPGILATVPSVLPVYPRVCGGTSIRPPCFRST